MKHTHRMTCRRAVALGLPTARGRIAMLLTYGCLHAGCTESAVAVAEIDHGCPLPAYTTLAAMAQRKPSRYQL